MTFWALCPFHVSNCEIPSKSWVELISGLHSVQWFLCSYYVLGEYGDRGCGLMKSSQILSYYISTFTMTVIAFDRYRIVHHPLGTRMKPWLPITMIWLVSTVFVLPTMVQMRISEYFTPKRLIYCRIVFPSSVDLFSTAPFRKFRATFVLVTQYIIPSVVSVILYALCLKKLILRKRIGRWLDANNALLCFALGFRLHFSSVYSS